MSEVHQPVEETVLVPVAATEELNAPATEATVDPIRPTGTDTLVPESRPEITSAADTTAGHHPGGDALGLTDNKLGPNETTVTAQPISEGILGHKAPGLIKYVSQVFPCEDTNQCLPNLGAYASSRSSSGSDTTPLSPSI